MSELNHDATHCADYAEGKCPVNCYRGQLTKDLVDRRGEFIGIPISYASFKGTSECEMSNRPKTEEMKMLDQLQEVLDKCDSPEKALRAPTMRSFIVLARIVYYLLSQRIKEKK